MKGLEDLYVLKQSIGVINAAYHTKYANISTKEFQICRPFIRTTFFCSFFSFEYNNRTST